MKDLTNQLFTELMAGADAEELAAQLADALNDALSQKEEEEEKAAAAQQEKLARDAEREAVQEAFLAYGAKYYPEVEVKKEDFCPDAIYEGIAALGAITKELSDGGAFTSILAELFGL